MEVGIGLPATIPGVARDALLEWTRGAEQRGFSCLGTIDRIVYPNYEPPDDFAAGAEKARAAWSAAGRDGQPRLMALCYYALGEGAREPADWYLHDYYGFFGPYADQIAASAATDEETISHSTDFDQVDRLAEAVL